MPQNRIRPADAFCSASHPVRTMQTTAGQHEADGWRNCSGCHYWRPLSDRSGTGSWTGRRVCHYCLDHQTRRPRSEDGRCLARTGRNAASRRRSAPMPRSRRVGPFRKVCK